MLQSYTYNHKKFNFLKSFPGQLSKNNITVIIGKNGTGKSTLLRSIVIDILRENVAPTTLKNFNDISVQNREFLIGRIASKGMPSKIICISTSPFDKFPILKRNQEIPFYSYLGLRGLPSQNLGLAYMSRIIYTLINSAKQSSAHARAIATVLDYLDYEPEIHIYSTITSPKLIEALTAKSEEESRFLIHQHLERGAFIPAETSIFIRQLVDGDPKTLRQVRKATTRAIEGIKRGLILSILSRDTAYSPTHPNILPEDLSLLSRFGIVKLKEVELRKLEATENLRMSDMSSGEQSVVMGLLGIASQLQDNALICIDEPEVCLHPAWQERYIKLLSHIFSHYRGCHFIIATHSPQIVAQLPDDKCYVMDMEDGVARPSNEFANRSIDYQLAALFKAPGFKNEYLSRISLNIFIRISRDKKINPEIVEDYNTLVMAYDYLQADDPVRSIIESIREMYENYARH